MLVAIRIEVKFHCRLERAPFTALRQQYSILSNFKEVPNCRARVFVTLRRIALQANER